MSNCEVRMNSEKHIKELCQTYKYPPAISNLLHRVLDVVLLPGTRSVVLIGSASRGELAYVSSASGLRLFSDIELSVVGDRFRKVDVNRALSRIGILERQQLKIGAITFHIDVSFTTMRNWRRTKYGFIRWETQETGWVLFGEDVRKSFRVHVRPEISVQSSLNRLWYLLLYFPERLIRGHLTEDDLEVFNYALSRAVLDFPIWLLVQQGILIPGFANRQRYLEKHLSMFEQQGFPIRELVILVDKAMHVRQFPRSNAGPIDMMEYYEVILRWYPRILSWTLQLNPEGVDETQMAAMIRRHHSGLYRQSDWKRRFWEIRLAKHIGVRTFSGRAVVQWLRENKQAEIITFLWCMHIAALRALKGDMREANEWLYMASNSLHRLWPVMSMHLDQSAFVDRWIALRRRFFDFIVLFYRGLRVKESYYRFVLDGGNLDCL